MATLVLVEEVAAAAELLAHIGHFLSQCSVLALQKGSAHGDLVLLQPSCITGALGCLVVLMAAGPILIILLEMEGGGQRVGSEVEEREENNIDEEEKN